MNNFVENINKKIANLIKDIAAEEKNILKDIDSDDEKKKINMISLYYRIVLNGCTTFSDDIYNYAKDLKQSNINHESEDFADRYYEKGIEENGDIELAENPPINIEVAEVYDDEDIVLEENPPINMEVAEVKVEENFVNTNSIVNEKEAPLFGNLNFEVSSISEEFTFNRDEVEKQVAAERAAKRAKKENDIELEENPPINMEVAEVYGDGDIVLEENPPINIEVAEVYDEDDIVLDENPPINIEVAEVYDEDDVVLEENPPINMEVAEVYDEDDIVLDENPPIDMEVAEVYDEDDIVLEENPKIEIEIAEVSQETFDKDEEKEA